MRDAMADLGGDPARVNPLVPADLVIDHSVQVDRFGTPAAFAFNVEREYERNAERFLGLIRDRFAAAPVGMRISQSRASASMPCFARSSRQNSA